MQNKIVYALCMISCMANVDKTVKMPPKPTIITINNNVHQKTQILNKIEKLFEPLKNSVSAFDFSFAKVNKKYLATGFVVGSAVATWSTISALLILDARFIGNIDNWAYWQGSVPLALLKEQDHKQLAKQLFAAIVQVYGFEDADFLTPLTEFMQALKQEAHRYKRFIAWHHFLRTWRVAMLFPGQKDSLALAENNLERLAFYKKLLLEWIVENKWDASIA